MAARIDTVSARARLKARGAPYWHRVATGAQVGYLAPSGIWHARWRDPDTGKRYQRSLGDFGAIPDHRRYDAAVKAAEEWFVHLGRGGTAAPVTVAQACAQYVDHVSRANGDAAAFDARKRFERHVYKSELAPIQLDKLRPAHILAWRTALEDKQTRNGKRTAASLNRDMTCLRAALNLAHENQLIATNTAWLKQLKPVRGAERQRTLYLDRNQRKAFIAAAAPDVALFMTALCTLPLRPGAMAALTAADYNRKLKTITVMADKAGAGRRIALPAQTAHTFADASKGKLPGAFLFTRADGAQWEKYKWRGAVKEAAIASGMPDGASLYTLRHSVITDLVHAGADLLTVAQISGTSLLMIERHYGHLRGNVAAAALETVAL